MPTPRAAPVVIDRSMQYPDLGALEHALSLISDGVILCDADSRVLFANRVACHLLGSTTDELHSRSVDQVFPIVDVESGARITDLMATLPPVALRKAVLLNGSDTPIIIEYSLDRAPAGPREPSRFVVVFRDIMARRSAEQALKSSESERQAEAAALFEATERAQVTLNSIADAVISTDFRGCITFMNNIAESMTGWSAHAAKGLSLDQVFYTVDSDTGRHVACPAMQAIIDNRPVQPAAQTTLIGRTGQELSVECRAAPIHDRQSGVVGAVMVAHDVSAARQNTQTLKRLALRDALTGLPNRLVLIDRLNQGIERAQRNQHALAVLFVDLDQFKPVNDQLGHACGDELLQQVAMRLSASVRGSDTVCRLGGDEFVIVLDELMQRSDAYTLAKKVVDVISEAYEVQGQSVSIGASVGVAIWPGDADNAHALLSAADNDMYRKKSARKRPASSGTQRTD